MQEVIEFCHDEGLVLFTDEVRLQLGRDCGRVCMCELLYTQ